MFCEKTHLCQSLFLNRVAGHMPATLLKKRLWHRCFYVNFAKFLGTPFLQNTCGRLLLKLYFSFYYKVCFPVNFAKFPRSPFLRNTSDDCFCLSNCACISIFFGMTFLFYEHCLSQVFSKVSLTRLGHFLFLKRKFSYDPATKLSNVSISFVKRFLSFKKQEQAAQFPARKIGQVR